MDEDWIVYAYRTVQGVLQCEAYGPTDQTTAQVEAARIGGTGWLTMALQLQPIQSTGG